MRIRCFTAFRIHEDSMHYTFIEVVRLLYTFFSNFSARHKEYMIYRISFSKFADLLPDFKYVSAIGNF